MKFELIYTPEAQSNLGELYKSAQTAKKNSRQRGLYNQVKKSLKYLSENPKHNSLNTHEYLSLEHPYDSNEKVFEAYAQNKTPGAYRIFWCYGPQRKKITILAITPHP